MGSSHALRHTRVSRAELKGATVCVLLRCSWATPLCTTGQTTGTRPSSRETSWVASQLCAAMLSQCSCITQLRRQLYTLYTGYVIQPVCCVWHVTQRNRQRRGCILPPLDLALAPDLTSHILGVGSVKDAETTQNSLGVRVSGLQVWRASEGTVFKPERDWARKLTDETIGSAFQLFASGGEERRVEDRGSGSSLANCSARRPAAIAHLC